MERLANRMATRVTQIFFVGMFVLLTSCQTQPTKTKENLTIGPNADRSRIITNETIILDTRPLFAFSAEHLPTAQPVRWDFFGQPQNPGLLRTDTEALARELARLGVAPDRHIVVLGLGRGGLGEEGRIAWMLSYLGIQNVSFAQETFFKMKKKSGKATPNPNAPLWSPKIDSSLIVSKKELLDAMRGEDTQYRIIDVRPVAEYLGKDPEAPSWPDISATNIPWDEFIDANGFPNRNMGAKLADIGITPDKRIVLISEEGVRSALVTQVLRELNYKNAGNFAGGFKELFASKEKAKTKRKKRE